MDERSEAEEGEDDGGALWRLECGWFVVCRSLFVIGRAAGEPQATCGPREETEHAGAKAARGARVSCSACLECDWLWYTARQTLNSTWIERRNE